MIICKSDMAKSFNEATTFLNGIEKQLDNLCNTASKNRLTRLSNQSSELSRAMRPSQHTSDPDHGSSGQTDQEIDKSRSVNTTNDPDHGSSWKTDLEIQVRKGAIAFFLGVNPPPLEIVGEIIRIANNAMRIVNL
ncbi:hypothetical protein U1Q18_019356 [Sarracenia purpurea var. burkii]